MATWSCTIGAIRIAAAPASADPSAQLTVAIQSGDRPTADAARWFSATAVVAMPNRVKRYSAHRATLSTAAMPTRMKRSSEIVMPNGSQHGDRELGCDERDRRAVAEHGARLEHDEHAERGHDAGERRGAPQPPHDQQVRQRADQGAGEEAGRPGDDDVVAVALDLPLDVRPDHADRAVGEVEHARAAVDHHQALGGQGVQRAEAEAQQGEPDDFLHGGPPSRCRRRALRRRQRRHRVAVDRPGHVVGLVVERHELPVLDRVEEHGAVEDPREAAAEAGVRPS